MFEVKLYKRDSFWNSFVFEFESVEEAQKFAGEALTHCKENSEEEIVVEVSFFAKYYKKGEKKEDN